MNTCTGPEQRSMAKPQGPGKQPRHIWEASYPPLLRWPYGVHSGFPRPVREQGGVGDCRCSFA